MKRILIQDLVGLFGVNLLLAGLAVWYGHYAWVFVGFVNLAGMEVIGAHLAQTAIERSQPYFDQKSIKYHALILLVWWTLALCIGLTIDTYNYVSNGARAWRQAPWAGVIGFVVLSGVMTPFYLLIAATSGWMRARRRKGKS